MDQALRIQPAYASSSHEARAIHEHEHGLDEDSLADRIELPLNLGLNEGTFQPKACLGVLEQFGHRTSMRRYTSADNDALREAISRIDGVPPECVFLHNGSGPILKQVIPDLIKRSIKSSPARVLRHLINKSGYPIVAPKFTYGKVPGKAAAIGLTVHTLPCGPESGCRIDPDDIEAYVSKRDALVYIANPNNPTGKVMISIEELEPLIAKYPKSIFWVDEAYVHYIDPDQHDSFAPLVARYPNLFVMRTFSFAYGLAGARVGYLLTQPDEVMKQASKLTNYRVGMLSAQLAVAALEDPDHLDFLRQECKEQRAVYYEALSRYPGVEAFDSDTNFILCRFTDGRTGTWLADELDKRGIHIKTIGSHCGHTFETYFRITLGLEHENRFLIAQLDELIGIGPHPA